MRAVVLDSYGGPDVLRTADLPDPEPRAGQVVVRVVAASVNPADWRLRSGQLRLFLRVRFPFVLGSDIAGTVERVGPGVDPAWVGRHVFAALPPRHGGAYAEQAVVDLTGLAAAPPGLTFAEAASLPLCGLTALQALRRSGVGTGTSLLVHGASGGVGTLAVQLGRILGATVAAVTSTGNVGMVASLGAARVLDYTRDDLSAEAGRHHVVVDAANALPVRDGLRLLRPGGTQVSVNPGAALRNPDWLARARGGRRVRSVLVRPDAGDLAELAGWASTAALRPVVERSYPLAEVRAAHERSATGRVRGKLVLEVDPRRAHQVIAADG